MLDLFLRRSMPTHLNLSEKAKIIVTKKTKIVSPKPLIRTIALFKWIRILLTGHVINTKYFDPNFEIVILN